MIKSIVRIFVLTAFLVTAVQSSALAVRHYLMFVNHSGYTIHELYLSKSKTNVWSEDFLYGKNLRHGDYRDITFHDGRNYNFHYGDLFLDIKVKLSNGETWRWNGINLEKGDKITVDSSGTITQGRSY